MTNHAKSLHQPFNPKTVCFVATFLFAIFFFLVLTSDYLTELYRQNGIPPGFVRPPSADGHESGRATAVGPLALLCAALCLKCWIGSRRKVGLYCGPIGRRVAHFWSNELLLLIPVVWGALCVPGDEISNPYLNVKSMLTGVNIGQIVGVLISWRALNARIRGLGQLVAAALVLALFVCAVYQPGAEVRFYYLGNLRWSGPFFNPNSFGVLMGVGLLLSASRLIWLLHRRRANTAAQESFVLRSLPWFVATAVFAYALFRSYSRGAWAGFLGGSAYLAYFWIIHVKRQASQARNGASVLVCLVSPVIIFVSLLIMFHFECRTRNSTLIRRILSAANINDFSWRNRATALPGALVLICDHPLIGVGWKDVATLEKQLYCPLSLFQSSIVPANDYLALGMSIGLPALALLLLYIGRQFSASHLSSQEMPNSASSAFFAASMRGALLVLLVGFLTEGGLFHVGPSAVFWTLLSLGAETSIPGIVLPSGDAT